MTLEQSFALAVQHHRAGRLKDAEPLYRQVLAQQPGHAEALHLLGVLAGQVGQNAAAEGLIRQAIAAKPGYAEAWFDLGNVMKNAGQLDEAIAACRQAIALKPGFPPAHYNLGNVLKDVGRPDEAIAEYRRAIALWPGFAEAHNNLGILLQESGQVDAAIAAYRQAIAHRPNLAEAHHSLGVALKGQGKTDEAIAACRQAIALRPDFPQAFNDLGICLKQQGLTNEAIAAFAQAVAKKPDYSEAHNNLGISLKEAGRLAEAESAYRRAIALKPDYAEVHYNLGVTLSASERPDEAIAEYRLAISLKSGFADAMNNLGTVLKETGRLPEAIAAYRRAIEAGQDDPDAWRNLLYTLHFSPDHDAKAIAEEHRRWNRRMVEPILKNAKPHANDRRSDHRLRVGYVSGDFRNHCQSLFIIPLLSHHDRSAFEIFCYSSVEKPDRFTQKIAGLADLWRDTRGWSDVQLCDAVRRDQIDILVDLEMHMANGRPLAFARKPAPVQVAWLAYPASTGSSAMDYALSDPWLAPPGAEDHYIERIVRLPETFWCYDPLDERDIPIGSLPAATNGFVTFSCLNNFCKVNESVIGLWAAVLRAVPSSRLILLCPKGSHRERTLSIFEREQIAANRIEFLSFQPRRQYMETYARADIGLDTIPYNGHTTSLDSFYMGVPVVTFAGKTAVGRAGVCQLMNLGLPDLIASTPEQFVQTAAALAGDLPRLARLRSTIRRRMQASPLMDAPRFARNIESVYRQMWRDWSAAG
jgi:predicted O-linked N-acetylglucosamine transferase (SPINDLY family)